MTADGHSLLPDANPTKPRVCIETVNKIFRDLRDTVEEQTFLINEVDSEIYPPSHGRPQFIGEDRESLALERQISACRFYVCDLKFVLMDLQTAINIHFGQDNQRSLVCWDDDSNHDSTNPAVSRHAETLPDAEAAASCIEGCSISDPYFDTPSSTSSERISDVPEPSQKEAPSVTFPLVYHNKFVNMTGRKMYMPEDAADGKLHSRRVLLSCLPPDVTLGQILRAVCCGDIFRASIFYTDAFNGGKYKSALLEFVYPKSASQYSDALRTTRHLFFENKHGEQYPVDVSLIPTQSYPHARTDWQRIGEGHTRTIKISQFPIKWLWYILNVIGLCEVVRVQVSDENQHEHGTVVIELTSIYRAEWAKKLVSFRLFDFYSSFGKAEYCCSAPDNAYDDMSELFHGDLTLVIPHVAPDAIQRTWNLAPYNTNWPMEHKPIMDLRGLSPRLASSLTPTSSRSTSSPASKKQSLRQMSSGRDEVNDDTVVSHSSAVRAGDDEEESDSMSRGGINVRAWERYGKLASHRRQVAAQGGHCAGQVPHCEGCTMGCRNMKDVAPSDVVAGYLKRTSRISRRV